MRRKDRETSKEFALSVIDQCAYTVLSMIDEEGMPYAVPISTVRDGNYIYFHGALEGKKADCLKNCKSVFMTFVGDTSKPEGSFTTNFESACVAGRVSQVTSMDEIREIMNIMCKFQNPANMANFDKAFAEDAHHVAVWKVEIEQITGKLKK